MVLMTGAPVARTHQCPLHGEETCSGWGGAAALEFKGTRKVLHLCSKDHSDRAFHWVEEQAPKKGGA